MLTTYFQNYELVGNGRIKYKDKVVERKNNQVHNRSVYDFGINQELLHEAMKRKYLDILILSEAPLFAIYMNKFEYPI